MSSNFFKCSDCGEVKAVINGGYCPACKDKNYGAAGKEKRSVAWIQDKLLGKAVKAMGYNPDEEVKPYTPKEIKFIFSK